MLARNMRFAPRPEEIGARAKLLVADLVAVRQTDPDRIKGVLQTIGRMHTEWPSTGQIIGMLRERTPTAHREFPRLSAPEMADTERENARKILAEIKRRLGWKGPEDRRKAEADLLAEAREAFDKNPVTRVTS